VSSVIEPHPLAVEARLEPGLSRWLAMDRRMLLGIRRRAEASGAAGSSSGGVRSGRTAHHEEGI